MVKFIPRALKRTSGFTLIELLVVILILSIAMVITASNIFSGTRDARSVESQEVLRSALDVAENYYEGDLNPNGSLTYEGFNKDAAKQTENTFTWQDGATLTPSRANSIRNVSIVSAGGGSDPKQITLCNSDRYYVYCADRNATGGDTSATAGNGSNISTRWGVSITQGTAVKRAQTVTGKCISSVGRALQYEQSGGDTNNGNCAGQ